jgi:hypothetical protein
LRVSAGVLSPADFYLPRGFFEYFSEKSNRKENGI